MSNVVSRNMKPQVSVVMPFYNSERYLKESIESVLSQTLTDFEFIIIDDGSKDGGADIVRACNDPRIQLIHQKNAGLPAALNRAIRAAKSDLIARMDSDDLCLPERLAKQYDYLQQHQDVAIVGTAATCIDECGATLADIKMELFYPVGELPLPESPCIHPSVMFRRSAFERAGGYLEEMRYGGEDAVLFNKILSFGSVANLPDPLVLYRLSHSSMSQKSRKFNRLLREIVRKKVCGKVVSSIEWQRLAEEYKRSGSGWFGYHISVGKLFLSDDSDVVRARLHLLKALQVSPLSLYAWFCLVGSYLPSAWRLSLRSYLKRRKKGRG